MIGVTISTKVRAPFPTGESGSGTTLDFRVRPADVIVRARGSGPDFNASATTEDILIFAESLAAACRTALALINP